MRDRRLAQYALQAIQAAQKPSGGAILEEALAGIQAMLAREDKDWQLISGDGCLDLGLTLQDLKDWSDRLSEGVTGSAWLKQGFNLRSSYIWQGGIQYDGISAESRGSGVNVQDRIDDQINQRAFFSEAARARREKRLYTDGLAIWIGNDDTKTLEVIPLREITNTFSDPDHADIIWAYLREWTRRKPNGKTEQMARWYFVDAYKDQIPEDGKISTDGKKQDIATGYTAFDMHVNTVDGWKFGSPDALAALYWNDIAKGLYMDGVDVSEAMASIIFTASGATAGAAQNAANQFASPQGAGSTAVMGAGNGMTAMTTAGRGYDFSAIREVLAVIATSLQVSNIALTSNPGDAGSSYGSASTLDLPVRLAMEARRAEHVDLDLRVLRWMATSADAKKKIKAYFLPLSDKAEQYRQIQSITMPWLQGVIGDEIYKTMLADILGVPDLGPTPEGMMLPNNKDSLNRKDVDADGSATAAAPGQGKSTGTASTGKAGDTRSDILSKN